MTAITGTPASSLANSGVPDSKVESGPGSRSRAVRWIFRVRETHVRDHLCRLISSNGAGAAKLDLVLRGIASKYENPSLPGGAIPPELSWSDLYDLTHPTFAGDASVGKSKWVNHKLGLLEELNLVKRLPPVTGRRPLLVVLADDGSREALDDPGGVEDQTYLTILGGVITSKTLTHWDGPALAGYLAASVAERHARGDERLVAAWDLDSEPPGAGIWMRPLYWFADKGGLRPAHHVRMPFSERTLRRGLGRLRRDGLITTAKTAEDPRTGRPFRSGRSRTVYTNRFANLQEPAFAADLFNASG